MKTFIWGIFLILSASFSFCQQIPKEQLRQYFAGASERVIKGHESTDHEVKPSSGSDFHSGVFQILQKLRSGHPPVVPLTRSGSDTLYIGVPPLDSLTITGTYTHTGPILVLGNGILRFKHANATIVGDLFVWGDHATVTSDSSYLYFPQQYFYQRSLVIAGNGKVAYTNTTLDHSGLSHNLVLTDSAKIQLSNVTNIGFTTCGMNRKAEIDINGINQAGEFVITDQSKLNFRHAKTILLWYHVPDSAIFHYSFPSGDSVQSYNLDSSTPGISGIDYSVRVDTSTDVMWALMPSTGSDVSISNSKIRSIGLWFLGHDTIPVSGLVDNSDYTTYTANLPDRSLQLTNSSVQTWSLYPMDTVHLDVTGCIVGEIGSESHCTVITTDAFVDGSGGYWWSTDNTFMAGENCMAVNAVRSSRNSIFIFAYSSLSQGDASAIDNSILMIVQCELPGLPVLYDKSCIWYSRIGGSSTAFVDSLVPLTGSAWIDKTPSSPLMDFACYQMYWQKSEDTIWHPIGGRQYIEKREEVLANWNTHGLSPGLYYLKLVLTDNTPDSNQNEAVKGINLLPGIFGIDEKENDAFHLNIYPDPITENSVAEFFIPSDDKVEISISDGNGKVVFRQEQKFTKGEHSFQLGSRDLPAGCYALVLKSSKQSVGRKFVK